MSVYINGIGLVSPQPTLDNQVFLEKTIALEHTYFPISEPVYKQFIHPRELRRMSKIIRNGLVAAKIALAEAALENPDAIITGTGLGCAIDTEKFLINLIQNKETLLTPTAFIQSTHNTLGGSIAIGLNCHQYNMTYVHRGFSFESALLDAELMIQSDEIHNALVGGFDEMTDNHIKLLQSTAMYHPEKGAKAGQGAGFFVLENEKKEGAYAELLGLETIYNPKNTVVQVKEKIDFLLQEHDISPDHLVVMMGHNGVQKEEAVYQEISETCFPQQLMTHFKHLCGEYYTASAFAFWAASQILKRQYIPESLVYSGTHGKKTIEHVLIYNQFQEKEHSLILLRKC
jgi:3-oxoacyl-(acyl-carrier-protein) synthase